MIAPCPNCGTRYRIDGARIRPEGAKLRCSRCEVVFRVNPPPVQGETAHPPRAGASKPVQPPAAPSPMPPDRPSAPVAMSTDERGGAAPSESPPDSSRLVLVADPEPECAKTTANALSSWGLRPILAHDGVEAIMAVQRMLPRVVIIDAALPKMFGFQICEFMKRNESLREIPVVLIGAIHHRDRYRRPPNELYGADAYIERPELPDALYPILEDLGLPVTGRSDAPQTGVPQTSASAPRFGQKQTSSVSPPAVAAEAIARPAYRGIDETPTNEFESPSPPQPQAVQPAAPVPATQAAPREPGVTETAPTDGEASEEFAQAERLARIIVSDIVLYNQEKFDAAVGAGNVVTAMQTEMEEARGLFSKRVDSSVREVKDFLTEELVRVARKRGMK